MMATTATSAEPIVEQSKKRLRQRLFRSDANDMLPLTIRHERIYILPTGRGMAFLGVVMIMLLASMNYRLNLGYALSFILVGLFASSLLATYLNLVKLTFVSVKAKDTFSDMPLVFEIAITATGNRLRHSIEIAASDSNDRIDIGRQRCATARLKITAPGRGVHHLGRITLSSDFPLGLWRGWGYVHVDAPGYVYPKPEIPLAPFHSSSEGNLTSQKHTDEREFKELRTYQITDSPSSVAWKTVARGGAWYSKQFESSDSNNYSVYIRWSDIEKSITPEQRLSRMCAWLLEAELKSLPYDFQLPAYDNLNSQRDFNRKQDCLRQLAMFNVTNNQS